MLAFQNIIDLRFAVSDIAGHRPISDVFARLVALAEDDMNSRLRTRMQIRDYTFTFDDGEAALPPDLLELIAIGGRGPAEFQVGPLTISMPGRAGDYPGQYYARLPSITCNPTATNWLLQRYPTIYLYGVAVQAARHLRDTELVAATTPLYAEALQLLKVDDERARWSLGAVRVKGCVP